MAVQRDESLSARSVWIEPIVPLVPQVIECSAIENLCAHVYPSPTYFWRLQPDQDVETLFGHFCHALSRLIYQQPHLAGSLRQDERGAFSVEIPPAPNAGTRLYFRDLSTDELFPTFDQLERNGFPFADGQNDGLRKLAPDPFPSSEAGDPVIVQQLSHVHGGLILVSSYTHLVGDLVQAIQLGVSWARHTRDVIAAAMHGRSPAIVPEQIPRALLDRTRMLPLTEAPKDLAELRKKSESLPNWSLIDPADPEATLEDMRNFMPKALLSASEQSRESDLRKPTVGIWRFSLSDRMALHQAAQQAAPSGVNLSSIDVLTAFIWKQFFLAKYSVDGPVDKDAVQHQSTLIYAGDVRSRLDPALPRAYMGAAVDFFRVTLPGSNFATKTSFEDQAKQLTAIALAIRQSNSSWDRDQFMTMLELSMHTPCVPGFVPRGPMEMLTTDHTRAAPLLSADWGPGLGRSLAFREPYLGRVCPAGEATLLPFYENGDVEVMISGESIALSRLRANKEMQQWSTCRFVRYNVVDEAWSTHARGTKL
ncbi:trichothecene 3-O-acetyltransferase [Teratosphaeria destructans]|uniref:Trichothecene 3-O-acetyltransferase n=1 Tax=Teratosphaeria destructans TaxID=418781 RepID=A0A9W7W6J3_9PEZI|nr:trichothecene 3-O-acetyltransferase [Teratosphaeria destructans]